MSRYQDLQNRVGGYLERFGTGIRLPGWLEAFFGKARVPIVPRKIAPDSRINRATFVKTF